VRQDVAAGVRPVTGDENDIGGAENHRPAEIRFDRFFTQIRKNSFSLQQEGSRDDAQRFHAFSFSRGKMGDGGLIADRLASVKTGPIFRNERETPF
jgi:hypothetical protein